MGYQQRGSITSKQYIGDRRMEVDNLDFMSSMDMELSKIEKSSTTDRVCISILTSRYHKISIFIFI